MKIDQGSPTRRLRVAIGHADNDAFLKTQYIAHVVGESTKHGQFRRSRITKYRINAKVPHHADEGFSHGRTMVTLVGHKLAVFGFNA
jgi:hypothetical protein